jgi:hypothetical protein
MWPLTKQRGLPSLLRSTRIVCAALCCAGALACADPRFSERDAGAETNADTGDLTSSQAAWLGRYAMRAYSFSIDPVLQPVGLLLSIVEIKPRGDGLVLEERACKVSVEGSFVGLIGSSFSYEAPSDLPALRSKMLLDDDTFSTEYADFVLGYDPVPPRECAPGRTVRASEAQSWLPNTCDCPTDLSTPPSSARDCRVNDPEADGAPGITLNLVVSTEIWPYHVAQHARTRYLDGYRGRDGLHANLETSDTSVALACLPPTPANCPIAASTPCPPKYNKAEFVPIDDSYDCKRVIREVDGLFPRAVPAFPASCLAER